MITSREIQPESWWLEKSCPIFGANMKNDGYFPCLCRASACAFWRQTKEVDGEKHGICTKA